MTLWEVRHFEGINYKLAQVPIEDGVVFNYCNHSTRKRCSERDSMLCSFMTFSKFMNFIKQPPASIFLKVSDTCHQLTSQNQQCQFNSSTSRLLRLNTYDFSFSVYLETKWGLLYSSSVSMFGSRLILTGPSLTTWLYWNRVDKNEKPFVGQCKTCKWKRRFLYSHLSSYWLYWLLGPSVECEGFAYITG